MLIKLEAATMFLGRRWGEDVEPEKVRNVRIYPNGWCSYVDEGGMREYSPPNGAPIFVVDAPDTVDV